jgi:hypothetical protein
MEPIAYAYSVEHCAKSALSRILVLVPVLMRKIVRYVVTLIA